MAKQLRVADHVAVDELEQRYRQARDAVERSHLQIVWLMAAGKRTHEVAEVTGYSAKWIREVVRRYNAAGVAGLGDRRHGNPGGAALLRREDRAALQEAFARPPADGGLWTSRQVAEWMAARTGRLVRVQRGWDYLRRLGYTPQVPRPRHAKADAAAQEAFKKTLRSRSPQ